jgi:hypothetical protein
LERDTRQSGNKLQDEKSEVAQLSDSIERMKTDNLNLKRVVDKQASMMDNMQKSIDALSKRVTSLETP